MKIIYATDIDTEDFHSWSGLGVYYKKMLDQAGYDVSVIDKIGIPNYPIHKIKKYWVKQVWQKVYSPRFNTAVSKHYAKIVNDKAPSNAYVISPNTIVLAYLRKDLKKILFADATFESLLNFYPRFSILTAQCLAEGREIDQQAVKNADLLIYTSQWAADSAINQYGADPAKVFVVPFGANLDRLPSYAEVEKSIAERVQNKHINLLFLGIDWIRKGGDAAIQVITKLNELGFPATLHIVGATNLPSYVHKRFVKNHGYISKATPQGQQELSALLSSSHFLLLPTLADCTPVACSEANAFGVPCITTDVGGLTSIITNNINGHTFTQDNFVEQAVQYITNLARSERQYEVLCHSSYNTYITELNWKSVGEKIVQLIKTI